MQWGGCLCIKNQEPDDSEPNLSNTSLSSFSRKQFAEFALVQEASMELRSGSAHDIEIFSSNVELVFCDPPQKSVLCLNALISSPLKRFFGETPLPVTLPNVIYPAPPSPSATFDESVVSCLSFLDHQPEVEFLDEYAPPKADLREVTIISASEKTERTPSVIFTPYAKENNLPPIQTSGSLKSLDPKNMRTACTRSSYLKWDEHESKLATETSSNYTIAANFDSSECSEFEAAESIYLNSLYPTESEGSDQECIWASFVPVTPEGGCTSSVSSSGRTSFKTSKLEYTTWESYHKKTLQISKMSIDADQSDSLNQDVLRVIV